MVYRIEGLAPQAFAGLVGLEDAALAARGALRVVADSQRGYPCRITLDDAAPGETLFLVNHVSHHVPTPFRTAYAIYVREGAKAAARFEDEAPAYLDRRTLGCAGSIVRACCAVPCSPCRAKRITESGSCSINQT